MQRGALRRWTSGLLLTLLVAPAAAGADRVKLSVREFRGEVGRGVEASFVIHAPLPQVYAVLANPRPGAEFLPFVTQVEVLQDDGTDQIVRYHARHLGLFEVDYTLRRRLGPPASVAFSQDKGLFRRTEGDWRLVTVVDGTRAIYRVQVDPGFYVPGAIQSFFLQQGLPALADAIRRRAESGGSWHKP